LSSILQHPLLLRVVPWRGTVPKGYSVDFLGIRYSDSMVSSGPFPGEFREVGPIDRVVQATYPSFDEEYFEWIDLMEAAVRAKGRFTMIELGAGFGRWLVRGAFAVRLLNSLPCVLIGIEAEPQHYRWMLRHFADNGISPSKHLLVNAAVSDTNGDVWFMVGKSESWYGQRIALPYEVGRRPGGAMRRLVELVTFSQKRTTVPGTTGESSYDLERVRSVTLNGLLDPLDVVDLVDLDVQGAELQVLSSASEQMSAKVKRVHIGTHGSDLETGLRNLFKGLGWKNVFDYSCSHAHDTEYGAIKFIDGVQSWMNPRFAGSPQARGP
jgi:FkbM family methyltransferase